MHRAACRQGLQVLAALQKYHSLHEHRLADGAAVHHSVAHPQHLLSEVGEERLHTAQTEQRLRRR